MPSGSSLTHSSIAALIYIAAGNATRIFFLEVNLETQRSA